MRHLGRVVTWGIAAVNFLFVVLLLLTAYSPHFQPVVHPLWSCLGLAFPVFLLLNLLFLFFWLAVQCYRLSLLPLLALLLCYGQIQTYIPINSQTDDLPDNTIKLLSYNVMGFAGCVKADGHNPILDYLQQSEADILCLQEFATSESPKHLTLRDINRALKAYPYRRINHIGDLNGYNQLAVYSKFPILSVQRLKYASDYNGSVLYEIKVGKDTLCLINNHLESNKLTKEDKVVYEDMLKAPEREKVKQGLRLLLRKLAEASAIRAPQADSIAAAVARSPHTFKVVCGDFNDSPISYTHRVIADGLVDAFTHSGSGLGISYNQNKFYFRIDNILTSNNIQSYNCTVDSSIEDSDHYPIWCYLSPRKENK